MKRVRIDFIQPIPQRLNVLRYGLLMFGVMSLSYSLLQQWQLSNESEALEWQQKKLTKTPRQIVSLVNSKIEGDKAQDSVKQAKSVLRQLNLPWDQLFPSVESAISKDIVLISLAPNPQLGSVTMQAIATNINAAINFSDRLKPNMQLDNIYLTQEEPQEENTRFPLQFKIIADWKIGP